MIYTVTFNPAIDYVVHTDAMQVGMVNRSHGEEIYYGGKGINVSVILKELGIPSRALGFVAGFTGAAIEKGVQEMGIATDFVHLESGFSRINVKIKSGEETELNGQGPVIDDAAVKALFRKLDDLQDGDTIILAGSIPNTMPSDIYEKILAYLDGRQIRTVVDATNDLLKNVLKYKPFLVRPNIEDLETMFDEVIADQSQLIHAGRRCAELGAENVILMMGKDGSLLINQDGVYHANSIDAEVVNSVGAADSMIAGFVMNYLRSRDLITTFKYANCCGIATAFSKGMATREKIESLFDEIVVTKIDENQ
mgnify:CR=1 FL=1